MTVRITSQGYPVSMVRRARELREAGWQYEKIALLLERETGRKVDKSTVFRWTGRSRAEQHAERERRRKLAIKQASTGGRLGTRHHTPDYQELRARALAFTAGMTRANIARAMDFDYPGQGWTPRRVLTLLGPARTVKQQRDEATHAYLGLSGHDRR